MDVTLGSLISLEITAEPTAAAARKTLIRLCRKDARVMRHQRIQQRKRPSWQTSRRGGRYWHHQMRSVPAVKLAPGSRYSIRATLDVIRDLESVKRWVSIAPA